MSTTSVEDTGLQRSLRQRHMTMISLGGVIGAGLFVGSGAVMNKTGPAAVVSYLLAGILVVLIMRMLGEMAVANPAVGSFIEYCRTALGPRAGFTIGWLYWWFWAIVLAIEAVAGATILQRWLPGVPVWAMSLVVMLLLTGTNLVSVKSYGEFEFWFASIKVAAIIAFIAIAAGFLLRMWFFPWLTYAAIAAMVAVIVAMALVEDVRSQLIPSFISLAVVLAAGWLRYRQAGARASVGGTQPSRT